MNNGKIVGDYRLLEPLGKGGAGQVYLATPTRDKGFATPGELVAVKLYNERVLSQKKQIERIRREFGVGSRLTNPHLVHIHECSLSDPSQPYLVMEFIDGMPLSEWIKMFHPVSEHLLINLLKRIANGLQALHTADVIHRDIKPENIMISSDFFPKIMDFGVVKVKHTDGETPSNAFLGTIRNASPEWLQREEDKDDPRTDLYSFGTVLYAMLHGHQVFHEEKQFARLVELVTKETPGIDRDLRNKPEPIPSLVKLTEKLLQKRPDDRLPDVNSLVGEIEAAAKTLPANADTPLHGYMATALTGVPDEAREAIAFKSSLIAGVCKSFEIYVYQPRMATDPLLHPDVEPEVVYARDRKRVLTADLLIAMADHPSLGVGQEIEIAGAFGIPTILVRYEQAKTKLSRMVSGSFLNFVGEVAYNTPEDLAQKLRLCVANNLDRIRSFRRSTRPGIPEKVGADLRSMRQATGMSLDEAAKAVGASPRLLQAVEEKPLSYHNAGLHLIGRLLSAYGRTATDFFASGPEQPRVRAEGIDHNIRRLEIVAKRAGWSAVDFLDLRNEYQQTLAASGDTQMVTDDMWRGRHNALEARKLQDAKARDPRADQTDLFGPKF